LTGGDWITGTDTAACGKVGATGGTSSIAGASGAWVLIAKNFAII
jgi:hypothetical protein